MENGHQIREAARLFDLGIRDAVEHKVGHLDVPLGWGYAYELE